MIKPALTALILIHALLASSLSAQIPAEMGDLNESLLRDDTFAGALVHGEGLIEAPLFSPITPYGSNARNAIPIQPIPLDSSSLFSGHVVSEPNDLLGLGYDSPLESNCCGEANCSGELNCGCGSGVCESGCEEGCGCNQCGAQVSSQWTPWQNFSLPKINPDLEHFNLGARFRQNRFRDRGIGYERVMFAPNVLDTAIVAPHVGIRYQLDYGLQTPDRAQYYWGDGPQGESGVNAQDVVVRLAAGSKRLMALTQYTMRSLDPEVNANTTGFGDVVLGAQALLVDGERTKVATIFRTHLATGPSQRGLGTGHTSLEYGLLARRCLRPETYLFSEIKYWTPIKGTSGVAGDVLTTGWGISTIAAESDVFAFLPTFEMRTLSFLFGGYNTTGGTVQRIDGDTAVELYPGARFVLGPENDMGLWEFGVAAGVTAGDDDWFDTRWVFDLRLSL